MHGFAHLPFLKAAPQMQASSIQQAFWRACESVEMLRQTFAASSAGERPVWVVTERAVFRLRPGAGLELMEVCSFGA